MDLTISLNLQWASWKKFDRSSALVLVLQNKGSVIITFWHSKEHKIKIELVNIYVWKECDVYITHSLSLWNITL